MQFFETLDDINAFLGWHVYTAALSYYTAGNVKEYYSASGTISAMVSDKGFLMYRADIFTRNLDIQYKCNCGYVRGPCSHVGATLIYSFYHDKQQNLEELITRAHSQNDHAPDEVIQFNFTGGPAGEDRFITEVQPAKNFPNIGAELAKRYRLVFQINDIGYYPRYVRTPEYFPLTIGPGAMYLKKDGIASRIEAFKHDKITEEVSREEDNFLQLLLPHEHKRDRLDRYLNLLAMHPELPVYIKTQNSSARLSIYPIEQTILGFKLKGIAQDTATFSPECGFMYNNQKMLRASEATIVMQEGFSLFALDPEGLLLYRRDDPPYARFITHMLNDSREFMPRDIPGLEAFIAENFKEQISLEFRAKSIRKAHIRPKPCINVAPLPGQLDLSLMFDYSGHVCESGKPSSLILADREDEHEIRVIQRDHEYEKLITSYVEMSLRAGKERPFYTTHAAGRHIILSADLKEFLVNQGAALIEKGIEIRLKGSKHKLHAGGGKLSLSISSAIDWFDAHLTYHDLSGNASPVQIDPELLSKGLLKIGDTYTLLTKHDIEKIVKLYEEGMDSSGHLKISKLNLSLIDELYAEIVNKNNELQSLHEIAGKLKNFEKIKDYPLPRYFSGTLRNYQRAGYNWLCFLKEYRLSGCLADDMGLGKTVQALAFLQQLKEEQQLETSLLIVPVSTITNWEQEIERFAPRLKYIRHAGALRIKDSLEHLKKYDLIIVSYQTLRNDIALFHEMEFDYLILDESQYIKNARSQSFKAVRSVKARHRLSLTGTPIENNTLELWAQMDFLNPGLLSSLKNYSARFARPIEAYGDKAAAARLRKTIFPFILRRKKEDVERELPEKELITMYSEMDEAQRMLYNQYRDQYREKIKSTLDEKGVERSAIEIFEALLRLRQIALFPGLVDEKHGRIESCKFETLKGMLDDILEEQHKVLIFSQFVKSLKLIEEHIKKLGYDYAYLDGSTKNRDREIKKFQGSKDVRVFLLSLKAGGVGINLTAADYVILFDPWWNPAVEMQAIDRAHRIGQTRKVIAYKMIVKDTVEEKILKLQEKKIALVNDLVREEGSYFKSLSKNAVLDLFE